MEIKPIAYFRSPFSSKFGIPKQAGLVAELGGQIVLNPNFVTLMRCVAWKALIIFG